MPNTGIIFTSRQQQLSQQIQVQLLKAWIYQSLFGLVYHKDS